MQVKGCHFSGAIEEFGKPYRWYNNKLTHRSDSALCREVGTEGWGAMSSGKLEARKPQEQGISMPAHTPSKGTQSFRWRCCLGRCEVGLHCLSCAPESPGLQPQKEQGCPLFTHHMHQMWSEHVLGTYQQGRALGQAWSILSPLRLRMHHLVPPSTGFNSQLSGRAEFSQPFGSQQIQYVIEGSMEFQELATQSKV